jgi:transcriptional regulator with XRE-family HTH domain
MPKNAIRAFRRRLGISQAELARRAKTSPQQIGRLEGSKRKLTLEWATILARALNCQASDLMFPENAQLEIGTAYINIFLANGETAGNHAISFHSTILGKFFDDAVSSRLQLYEVNTNEISKSVSRGDFLLVDRDTTTVTKPGVYLIDIAGVKSWRYLTPSVTGLAIVVHSDSDQITPESVAEGSLTILGRACMRISAL